MPAIDMEQHFKFLIACIKHSEAGKVRYSQYPHHLKINRRTKLRLHSLTLPSLPRNAELSPRRPRMSIIYHFPSYDMVFAHLLLFYTAPSGTSAF